MEVNFELYLRENYTFDNLGMEKTEKLLGEISVQRVTPQTVTRFEPYFGKHDGANQLAYRATVL